MNEDPPSTNLDSALTGNYKNSTHLLRIKITPATRKALLYYRDELKFATTHIFKTAKNIPEGLDTYMVSSWLTGKTKTAQKEHLDFVLNRYKELETNPQRPVPITPEILEELKNHVKRTGAGGVSLLKNFKNTPPGLTPMMIQRWLSGTAQTAQKNYLDYVLYKWKSLPAAHFQKRKKGTIPQGSIKFTKETLQTLREYRKLTRLKAWELLKDAEDVPDKLNAEVIESWFLTYSSKVRKDHLDYVLNRWSAIAAEYVRISEDIVTQLKNQKERTKTSPIRLLENAEDIPEGLAPTMIKGWLSNNTKTARKDHLDYVLKKWESLPSEERVKITDKLRTQLRAYQNRTGLGPIAFFKTIKDAPEGLTAHMISSWLSGAVKTTKKEYLDYVLKKWGTLPSNERIEITDSLRAQLRAHQNRTGIGPVALLKNTKNIPEKVNTEQIKNWLYGPTKTARKDHLDYILKLWACTPDKAPPKQTASSSLKSGKEKITVPMRHILRDHQSRTGIRHKELLKGAKDIPEGLGSYTIGGWLSGRTQTAHKNHLDYVLNKYESLPTDKSIIPLDQKTVEILQAERKRTNVSAEALFKNAQNIPEGLRWEQLQNWFQKRNKNVRAEHLQYVLGLYKELPDYDYGGHKSTVITEHILMNLHEQREQTGIDPEALLQNQDENKPQGLNADIVESWLEGKTTTAKKDHLDYVLSQWKLQNQKRSTKLTKETLDTLRRYQHLTGIKPVSLLKDASDIPAGLSSEIIHKWLARKDKIAQTEHLNYVLKLWKSQPGAESIHSRPLDSSPLYSKKDRIEITEELRQEIRLLHANAPANYLRRAPKRFTPVQMAHICSGRNKTIPKDALNYLRACSSLLSKSDDIIPNLTLKSFPEKIPERPAKKFTRKSFGGVEYVEITDSIYKHLHKEVRRTFISPCQILKNSQDVPKGLTKQMTDCWLSGKIRSTEEHYLEYMIEEYANLPDADKIK